MVGCHIFREPWPCVVRRAPGGGRGQDRRPREVVQQRSFLRDAPWRRRYCCWRPRPRLYAKQRERETMDSSALATQPFFERTHFSSYQFIVKCLLARFVHTTYLRLKVVGIHCAWVENNTCVRCTFVRWEERILFEIWRHFLFGSKHS